MLFIGTLTYKAYYTKFVKRSMSLLVTCACSCDVFVYMTMAMDL